MKKVILLTVLSVVSGALFCATPINVAVYTKRQFDVSKSAERRALERYKGTVSKSDQESTIGFEVEGSFTKEEMLTLPFADLLKQIWGLIS